MSAADLAKVVLLAHSADGVDPLAFRSEPARIWTLPVAERQESSRRIAVSPHRHVSAHGLRGTAQLPRADPGASADGAEGGSRSNESAITDPRTQVQRARRQDPSRGVCPYFSRIAVPPEIARGPSIPIDDYLSASLRQDLGDEEKGPLSLRSAVARVRKGEKHVRLPKLHSGTGLRAQSTHDRAAQGISLPFQFRLVLVATSDRMMLNAFRARGKGESAGGLLQLLSRPFRRNDAVPALQRDANRLQPVRTPRPAGLNRAERQESARLPCPNHQGDAGTSGRRTRHAAGAVDGLSVRRVRLHELVAAAPAEGAGGDRRRESRALARPRRRVGRCPLFHREPGVLRIGRDLHPGERRLGLARRTCPRRISRRR